MKPLNQLELDSLVHDLNENLRGAQLQDCTSWESGLIFWHFQREDKNLLFDFSQSIPFFLIRNDTWPLAKRRKPFPVNLFLNSHAKNLFFESARVLSEWGRVIEIVYRNKISFVRVQFNLIPKQVNFLVEADNKSIYFLKPKELNLAQNIDLSEVEVRSVLTLHKEWMNYNLLNSSKGLGTIKSESTLNLALDPVRVQIEKNILKKKRALNAMTEQIQSYDILFWKNLGDKVKSTGLASFTAEESKSLSDCQSVGAAIQKCFLKYKQIQNKIEGSKLRQQKVMFEIAELEARLSEDNFRGAKGKVASAEANSEKSSSVQFKDLSSKKAQPLKVRKLELSPSIHAYIGKSATDNLSLLRQARAWDFWLHLKDYPGAYGIIRREKNETIALKHLQEVAIFVAKNSSSAERIAMGQKLSVVYVECRHVRPIKGAKPGVVTYNNAKELSVEF